MQVLERADSVVLKPSRRECEICASKRSYPSKNAALLAKYKYDRLYGAENRPYVCSTCGQWHLTTHVYDESEAESMECTDLLIPRSLRGEWARGSKGMFVFTMPEGCKYAGYTYVFPARNTRGRDDGDLIVLKVPDGWNFHLSNRQGDDVDLDAAQFEAELLKSFEGGFIANPHDQYQIDLVLNESRQAFNGKAKDKGARKRGGRSEDKETAMPVDVAAKKTKAIEYCEKYPELTSKEVAKLVGLTPTEVERVWAERDVDASGDLGHVALRLSQVCEEIIATRGVINNAVGTVTAADLLEAIEKTNYLLALTAMILIARENPGYEPSKKAYAKFNDVLSAAGY